MTAEELLASARRVMVDLGLPRAQQNERSALCLLALLDLRPGRSWTDAGSPLIGITPIMEWAREQYGKSYAPNTRETVRRQTMHQFVDAGIALYNPDNPARPVNSPHAVYQVSPAALGLLRSYGGSDWPARLAQHLAERETLAAQYARAREHSLVPVQVAPGKTVLLSPGEHSELIRAIIEAFAPRFVPGAALVYAGDTGYKWGYVDGGLLANLGVDIDPHGKMPDVVIYDAKRGWLVLVESVTSHGPVDGKRHSELERLFARAKVGIVYVTAFPSRAVMARYVDEIAWETEVWCASDPSHLIHFNGDRFFGPHA